MNANHPTNEWYAKLTNVGSPGEQGLVIDETTGASIAVTYDAKHAAVIAHAVNMFPKLLAALEMQRPEADYESDGELVECIKVRRDVLNEANHPPA